MFAQLYKYLKSKIVCELYLKEICVENEGGAVWLGRRVCLV